MFSGHLIGGAAGKIHTAAQSQLKWLIRVPHLFSRRVKTTALHWFPPNKPVFWLFRAQPDHNWSKLLTDPAIYATKHTLATLQLHLYGGFKQLQSLEQANHVTLIISFYSFQIVFHKLTSFNQQLGAKH